MKARVQWWSETALLVLSAVVILIVFIALVGAAEAQSLRGEHPHHNAPDPYRGASTFPDKGAQRKNCCHGKDCARFHGEPTRGEHAGVVGYWFGKWFVPQPDLIDPKTITAEERGHHQLCIGYEGTPAEIIRCGYVAQSS